jgi:imidazoleglycerol phosphate dehydratase HisB
MGSSYTKIMGPGRGGRILVVVDLSNRPHFESDIDFGETGEYVDDVEEGGGVVTKLSVEMLYHVFESIVSNGRMTVHFKYIKDDDSSASAAPNSAMNLAVACMEGFGACLGSCVAIDTRRRGGVSSSKGTLSV